MSLVKAVVGLCLGIALFSAFQAIGVRSLQEYLNSGNPNAGLPIGTNAPIATSFDADALKNAILPKYGPIDTTEGQRLGGRGRCAADRHASPQRAILRAGARSLRPLGRRERADEIYYSLSRSANSTMVLR